MKYVTATQCDSICIGRQGENKVVTVQFDVSGWQEMYGNGAFSLLHQRSADMSAYPCVITADTNTVSWVITSTDVFYVGYGKAQLLYIVDDKVAKSVVFTTNTLQSLNAGSAPDPEPEWIADVVNAGLDAEAYAIGTRGGEPVGSQDIAYHNNAKYWAQQAASNKLFWCTYGTTTYEQITTALGSGLLPAVMYTVSQRQQFAFYLYKLGGTYQFYGATSGNKCYMVICTQLDVWSVNEITESVQHLTASNKFVYGSNGSTDERVYYDTAPTNNSTKLLTSGSVYTAVDKVGQLLINKGLITQAEWDAR